MFCERNHGFSFTVLYNYLLYSYDNPYLHLNYSSEHGIPFLFRDKGPLDFLFLQHKLIKSFITCIDIDLIGNDSPIKRYMENEGLSYGMAGLSFAKKLFSVTSTVGKKITLTKFNTMQMPKNLNLLGIL